VTYWEVFRSLLDQIAHEDSLLIARTWLLIGEFLLLLVYFSIDPNKAAPRPAVNHHRLIGFTGIISTIFIYSAILAAEFEFVLLRTRIQALAAEHAELPMRRLPSVGIGAGLVCPILLGLLVLYIWIVLTIGNRWTAALTVVSGLLFAVFFVGEAHEFANGTASAFVIKGSLALALAALVAAGGVTAFARSGRN
jgi:hypothetical protein